MRGDILQITNNGVPGSVRLVNTPSDYGFNGEKPSHPELLDWLATEFVRDGWQLKPLHRLIVLSSTYRQASQSGPRNAERRHARARGRGWPSSEPGGRSP